MSTICAELEIRGEMQPGFEQILTPEACEFLVSLVREFRPKLKALLAQRQVVQARYDSGELPDFLSETAAIRAGDWKVARDPC